MELARLQCTEGQYEEALQKAHAARLLFQETGEAGEEVRAMSLIGVLQQNRGHQALAVKTFEQALERARSRGARGSEASILGTLGLAALNQGDWEASESLLEEALTIQRSRGDVQGACYNLGNLALLYHRRGQALRSIELHGQAIDCARTVGDKASEGVFLGNLGEVLSDTQRYEEAEDALVRAIGICDASIPPAAGAFRASLGLLMGRMGRFDEVRDLFDLGEAQVAAIPPEHVRLLCKKGHVCQLSGDVSGAHAVLTKAREVAGGLDVAEHSEVSRALARLEASLSD